MLFLRDRFSVASTSTLVFSVPILIRILDRIANIILPRLLWVVLPPYRVDSIASTTAFDGVLGAVTSERKQTLYNLRYRESRLAHIVPLEYTQTYNIPGALCLADSVIVGVFLNTTTTTAVVSCSFDFISQLWYLQAPFRVGPGVKLEIIFDSMTEESVEFGRSPQCISYSKGEIKV